VLDAAVPEVVRDAIAFTDMGLRTRLLDGGPPLVSRVATLGLRDVFATADPPPADALQVPVHLYGGIAVIGPAEEPAISASPCGTCLARRWQILRPEEERNVIEGPGAVRVLAGSPYLTEFALDAVAVLCRYAAQAGRTGVPAGHAWVYELALDTLRVTPRLLLADGGCPRCAVPPPDHPEPAAPDLRPRPKRSVDDSRIRGLHDYDLPIDAYANPLCGALGPAAMPALTSPTTSPVTGGFRLRGQFGYAEFFWSGHADRYDDSALLGVLEGVERRAGLVARGPAGRVVDTYRNLADRALDPRECGVYTDEAYRLLGHMYRPFDEDTPLGWVWGHSLRDRRPILVPEQIVYYGNALAHDGSNFVMECSNGCASGGCFEEAVFHGLLEVIERDAFLLGWFGKARLPEIDPASCAGVDTLIMIDRVRRYGYDVRLFDNRIDLPVPVVTAVAVRRDGGLGRLSFAAGAGLDPENAVRAALCEIASYVPDFDERTASALDEARALAADHTGLRELRQHALLFGLPEMATHADFLLGESRAQPMSTVYADWQRTRPRNPDLLADVDFLRDELAAAGHDVIVVDQTSPEQRLAGLHTACVIVPGLIPIDFGFWRQRGLNMPRTLSAFRRAGWRSTDLDPADLNRVPHPFP
jgi:ribosomal protein S12 methylthiotransferase accessory factor